MRIDAHQHFWELSRFDYPWMPPVPSKLRYDYLPEDLAPVLARNNFDGTVLVQATTDPVETDWLLSLADRHEFILGVVGWVDLTSAKVGSELDRLQKRTKFVGVRHPVENEADDDWLLRSDVVRGLEEVAQRGLPYDLLLRPRHLSLVVELADRIPGLPLVIDHLAKPPVKSGELEPWARDLARVAAIEQVHVKISGLITEADHETWTPDDLRPYVQHAWNLFGPWRCMFGSDWPVCIQAGIWKRVLAGFTQALGPVPKEIRAGVMGENAARFYRLRVP
jgi:L-fuconolactonase